MGVRLVTDSTSYIPKDLQEKYGIKVVSLNITMGDQSIREVDISNEEFYRILNETKQFPKSSQPALDEVSSTFENIILEGHDIIGVFLSSDMSGTYSSAHIIKEDLLEKYPNSRIELIDSRSNCMQMGIAVLEGAKKAAEGCSIEEVVEAINFVVKNSRFLFTPDTLDYLKMGGRIGSAGALFGKLLQIKPILTVNEGKTDVLEKVRTKNKAIEKILSTIIEDYTNKGIGEIIVHHINCEEEGNKIADLINNKIGIKPRVVSIGPVIGVHVGPGAIGIAYSTK